APLKRPASRRARSAIRSRPPGPPPESNWQCGAGPDHQSPPPRPPRSLSKPACSFALPKRRRTRRRLLNLVPGHREVHTRIHRHLRCLGFLLALGRTHNQRSQKAGLQSKFRQCLSRGQTPAHRIHPLHRQMRNPDVASPAARNRPARTGVLRLHLLMLPLTTSAASVVFISLVGIPRRPFRTLVPTPPAPLRSAPFIRRA